LEIVEHVDEEDCMSFCRHLLVKCDQCKGRGKEMKQRNGTSGAMENMFCRLVSDIELQYRLTGKRRLGHHIYEMLLLSSIIIIGSE